MEGASLDVIAAGRRGAYVQGIENERERPSVPNPCPVTVARITNIFSQTREEIANYLFGEIHGIEPVVIRVGAQISFTQGFYVGQTISGFPDGKGTMLYHDGSTYEGEFRLGKIHGLGMLILKNKDLFLGNWNEGILSGPGLYNGHDGSAYEGEFDNGRFHGEGFHRDSFGYVRKGFWKNGLFISPQEPQRFSVST
jgi:hypothetical protein